MTVTPSSIWRGDIVQVQLKADLFEDACRRRSERRDTATASSYIEDGTRIEVLITNLSLQGARLTTPQPLAQGRHIWLKMPMLSSRRAAVIWARGSEAGVEFCEELHPMIVEVIARVRPPEESAA